MLIAVIGSKSGIAKVKNIVESEKVFCEVQYLVFANYIEMVEIIKKVQNQYDALLFTGVSPYRFALKHTEPSIPWVFLPHSRQAFMGILLSASAKYKYDIAKVSIDSYERDLIYDIYEEIGFSNEEVSLFFAERRIVSSDYLQYLIQFHKSHYKNGNVNFCLSGFDAVVNELQKMEVPCLHIDPQNEVILQTFNSIRLNQIVRENDNQEIISTLVKIKPFNRRTCGLTGLDEFRMMNRAKEYLYRFAHQMNAILLEVSPNQFLLLSSKKIFVQHTKNFRDFSFFKEIDLCENVDMLFVGIGIGDSFAKVLQSAETCVDISESFGKSCIYLMEKNEIPRGPFAFQCTDSTAETDKKVNDRLLKISNQTGIGIAMLIKIESIVKENMLDIMTSTQLSSLLRISPRRTNRIIQKLEDIGCIQEVGREARSKPGRPHRLLKIDFNA